jgi:osmotically-inducible protein OsmY
MAVDTRYTEAPPDDEIRENATNAIHGESDLEDADVDVYAAHGWITLRGTVDAHWKKQRAQETVSTLPGVRGVTNELAVVPSRTYEDRLIADSIVAALERNIDVDASTIDVRVNGGEVTLSGSVPSLPAFRAAQATAEDTPGVVAVNNDLEIR